MTLTATIGGAVNGIIGIAVITTTAQYGTVNIVFHNPVKVDRASNINLSGTFAAGVLSRQWSITGWTEKRYN